MADVYKVKADTSIPRAVRTATTNEGVEIEETAGQAYSAGDYVLASNMTKQLRERAESGDLDHLLEPSSMDEYEQAVALATRVEIPEHEAERYIQIADGRKVVEKDQVVQLRAAGADGARAFQESQKNDKKDERATITEQESFVEVSSIADDDPVLPKGTDEVDEDVLEEQGVEVPPGLPVGKTLARAAGDDPDKRTSSTRKRPGAAKKDEKDSQGD